MAEPALDDSEDFMFQSLQTVPTFETLRFGIIIGDLSGRIVYRNPAALDIYGSNEIPAEPRKRALLHILKVGEREFPVEQKDLPLPRIIQEGAIQDQEFVIFTGNGSRRKLSYSGRTLYKGKDQIGAILFLFEPSADPNFKPVESQTLEQLAETASSEFQSVLIPPPMTARRPHPNPAIRILSRLREILEPVSRLKKTLFLKNL